MVLQFTIPLGEYVKNVLVTVKLVREILRLVLLVRQTCI